jgi:hypothetical protein
MDAYCKEIRKLEGKFYGIEYSHVVRDKNQVADALSKLGSSRAQVPHDVFVQDLLKPSIKQEDEPVVEKPPDQPLVAMVPSSTTTEPSPTIAGPSQTPTKIADWRVPFIKYLTDGTGYSDRNENERLIRRSRQYLVVEGKLWRKNAKAEVLMKCIEQEDGIKLLKEIHSGTYGNHTASRTLVGKAFRAGFYWPSAVADVEKLVRHCAKCQFFSKRIHVLAHEIQTIPASWPFACWGLDMIGPFKPAPGNFKFVFMLIDKFSKWIEYMPLVKASSEKVVEFLDQVIHHFGIPNNIIIDLGTQFTGNTF